MPLYSWAGIRLASPFSSILKMYSSPSGAWPSKITAVMPKCPRAAAIVPPALLSFIVPVSGLFAPTETLLVFAKLVPLKRPGATMSLFSGPRGSHVACTSALIMIEVRPLPPKPIYSCGTSSTFTVLLAMFTLKNFISPPPFFEFMFP